MRRPKPKFRIGQSVTIAPNGYTGQIVDKAWIAGGWCYKLKGGNWRGEEGLTLYRKREV